MNRTRQQTALFLAYFTVGYNVLEGTISILFAIPAQSAALFGFGIDSFVESLSGLVMAWRFGPRGGEHREARAMRLVGMAVVVFAAYVAYESTSQLYWGEAPAPSLVGIVIAVASLVVMPVLFAWKRRLAAAVRSRSLLVDAKQTLACMLLSVALLVGLILNYALGWWRADPIAGLFIAAFLAREGYRAIAERELCCASE
jgi:divalent metal cation (Fe/Co/Zn/Cd) transporter